MSLLFLHAGAMITGFLLIAAGAGIARYQRQKRWWLKAHRTIGVTGSTIMLLGFAAAIIMVEQSGSGHIRVLHAGGGLMTILLSVITFTLGLMQFRVRDKAGILKVKHRWCGRFTLLIGLMTILSGLHMVELIG